MIKILQVLKIELETIQILEWWRWWIEAKFNYEAEENVTSRVYVLPPVF